MWNTVAHSILIAREKIFLMLIIAIISHTPCNREPKGTNCLLGYRDCITGLRRRVDSACRLPRARAQPCANIIRGWGQDHVRAVIADC